MGSGGQKVGYMELRLWRSCNCWCWQGLDIIRKWVTSMEYKVTEGEEVKELRGQTQGLMVYWQPLCPEFLPDHLVIRSCYCCTCLLPQLVALAFASASVSKFQSVPCWLLSSLLGLETCPEVQYGWLWTRCLWKSFLANAYGHPDLGVASDFLLQFHHYKEPSHFPLESVPLTEGHHPWMTVPMGLLNLPSTDSWMAYPQEPILMLNLFPFPSALAAEAIMAWIRGLSYENTTEGDL